MGATRTALSPPSPHPHTHLPTPPPTPKRSKGAEEGSGLWLTGTSCFLRGAPPPPPSHTSFACSCALALRLLSCLAGRTCVSFSSLRQRKRGTAAAAIPLLLFVRVSPLPGEVWDGVVVVMEREGRGAETRVHLGGGGQCTAGMRVAGRCRLGEKGCKGKGSRRCDAGPAATSIHTREQLC